MNTVTSSDNGNSFYRYLNLFNDILKLLTLTKILNINGEFEEDSAGTEQDLYDYIGKFRQLEHIELLNVGIQHIFRCGLLIHYSPIALVRLDIIL